MKPFKLKVKLITTTELLGTQTKSEELMAGFLAEKRAKAFKKENIEKDTSDEVISPATIDDEISEKEKKRWTGFMMEGGKAFVMDYYIKGFFKNAALKTAKSTGFKNGQSKIAAHVFINPRKIFIEGQMAETPLERPLRAMTMQGPRVSLIKSDYFHPEAELNFDLHVPYKCDITADLIDELLKYGQYNGIGQFRGGGYGRFEYEIIATEDM